MDTAYLYDIDEELLDFYDPVDYCDIDSLDSPCSAESDQENHPLEVNGKKSIGKIYHPKKILQRKAANQRERRRMKSINDAFDSLRQCIPDTVNVDRRLSKVDTLRLAIRYIGYLSELIDTSNDYSADNNTKETRPQEKIILRCHFAELPDSENVSTELVGHSLSWSDEKCVPKTIDNKLTAKVWIPENPTDTDLLNLTTYATDYCDMS